MSLNNKDFENLISELPDKDPEEVMRKVRLYPFTKRSKYQILTAILPKTSSVLGWEVVYRDCHCVNANINVVPLATLLNLTE